MGSNQSSNDFERPSDKHSATLYYFSGRGLADQIRWMLAATDVDFCQKVVASRDKFLEMAGSQLPFGQLPLLQIDNMDIVQSQAAVRYLARRAHIQGSSAQEALKCDMIAEAVRDLLSLLTSAPFRKYGGPSSSGGQINAEEWAAHLKLLKEKWAFTGGRFEAIIKHNLNELYPSTPKKPSEAVAKLARGELEVHMVGSSLTYADVLVAHAATWIVEECGSEAVRDMPLLVTLQNQVISLPGVKKFIKSVNYFPLGDRAFVEQVNADHIACSSYMCRTYLKII